MDSPSPFALAYAEIAKGLRSASSNVDAAKCWEKGDLSYKFWNVQKKMAQVLEAPGSLKKVLNCSRRLRKTSTALVLSIQDHLKRDGPPTRIAAPTGKMLRNIIHPIMRLLCEDAPEKFKPVWKSQDGFYLFPHNGTQLYISGTNNGHEDDLRGVASRRCIVDEAQSIDKLKYLINDVLMPQLISTNGDLWILFTPPKTPIHEVVEYAQEAKIKGAYAEYNIHESEYPKEVIEEFCKESGGEESTTWQREYLCQIVVDSNFSIVPEWQKKEKECVYEYVPDEFYKFYLKYAGMDMGVKDLTAVLFGIYDFKKGKLFIQDEFTMNGPKMTTNILAEEIKKKEKELWNEMTVHNRIADNNDLLLLQDLSSLHQIYFLPTLKDTLEAMVNYLRLWISAGRIIISPRCKHLIGCLKYGVWNDKRTEWERHLSFGHFDGLAALMYLVRNIDQATNPIPPDYGLNPEKQWISPGIEKLSETEKMIRDLFSSKVKRR